MRNFKIFKKDNDFTTSSKIRSAIIFYRLFHKIYMTSNSTTWIKKEILQSAQYLFSETSMRFAWLLIYFHKRSKYMRRTKVKSEN